MRFSVHTAARVCTLLQRRPNTLVPGQRRAADEIRPERRKHYSAADHRRAAPSLRPDMIYDMDTGHEHEITSFKNRHSAGKHEFCTYVGKSSRYFVDCEIGVAKLGVV